MKEIGIVVLLGVCALGYSMFINLIMGYKSKELIIGSMNPFR